MSQCELTMLSPTVLGPLSVQMSFHWYWPWFFSWWPPLPLHRSSLVKDQIKISYAVVSCTLSTSTVIYKTTGATLQENSANAETIHQTTPIITASLFDHRLSDQRRVLVQQIPQTESDLTGQKCISVQREFIN